MTKINFLNYKITDRTMLSKLRNFCIVVKEISPLRDTASDTTIDWLGEQLKDYINDVSLDLWDYFDKFDPNMIEGWDISLPDKFIRSLMNALDNNPDDVFEWLDKQDER